MVYVRRAAWGARRPRSQSIMRLPQSDVWLHHTAGSEPDGPAGVRAVQNFHMDVRGWYDIAYSFVIDRRGSIFEGRGPGVAGAHTQGHNSTSHAICVLGNYDRDPVPQPAVDAVVALLHRGVREGWWPVARLAGGHRDVGTTSCPGDRLYRRIDDINRAALAEETPVDAVLLVHPTTGTPDTLAALNAVFDRPDQLVGLVCNPAAAKKALREGKRVYAIGGPACQLVAGDKDLAGANRLDTSAKVLDQSRKGW